MKGMRYLVNDCIEPQFNMALDQWGLEKLECSEEPVLWLWRNRPSVIVGANQNVYSEVNLQYLEEKGICLARRTTGGGAVYHDLQNLNYSIVGTVAEIGDGQTCVEAVATALRKLGADAEVSGRNDILVGGRKVSGFARRNWKDRVMVHGTLMYDVDIETLTKVLDVPGSKLRSKGIESVKSRVANLKDFIPGGIIHFRDSLREILADNSVICLTEEQITEIQNIADSKFSAWEWIYGHSRSLGIERTAKLACGNVTVRLDLDRGTILDCSFEGDFLGMRPSSEISDLLKGARYDRSLISGFLPDLAVSQCFTGATTEDLLSLLGL